MRNSTVVVPLQLAKTVGVGVLGVLDVTAPVSKLLLRHRSASQCVHAIGVLLVYLPRACVATARETTSNSTSCSGVRSNGVATTLLLPT